MSLRLFLPIACLAALLLAGCRTDPYVNAHIESVNAEYRQLENKLYVAEDENRRMQADIARLEEENRRLRGGAPAPSRSFRGGGGSSPAIDGSIDLSPPEIDFGGDSGPAIETPGIPPVSTPPIPRSPETDGVPRRTNREDLDRPRFEGPTIELENAPAPTPKPPATPAQPQPAPAPLQPDPLPAPQKEQDIKQEPEPIDARVTQIFLNPLLTGGDSLDREPGDDGLSVVIEPRNKQNQFVPQAGKVSVVVLDPSKQGNAARVARWDFDPDTTKDKLNRVSSSRGIHLRMPWPANPPSSNKLHVFVRYETPDGRKLQADREINIAPPGQYSNRWTPRSPDRPRHTEQIAKAAPSSSTAEPTPATSAQPASPKPPTPSAQPAPQPATGNPANIATNNTPTPQTPPADQGSPTQATRPRPEWSPYR